ncbi:MAG: hypothetical protein DWP97_11835 [Calditrichaeota bacterium]|nr:MAG: hypothetical protein DWP97_11835 [Calditrichota bacterium]
MIKPLNYSIMDVLWSPIRALSAKKIMVMTLSLLVSLLIYNLFTYLAFWIDNDDISTIFNVYAFFPFYKMIFGNLSAQFLFYFGILCSVLTIMLGFTGVSILEIEIIRGNRFMSPFAAIKFALKRFKQLFLAELGIALFIGFIILLFMLFGLVGRIPYIGEWIYSILFVIPNLIIAILTVFIFAVFCVSVFLLPSVTAAERKGEAFQSILETFSTIILQPLRWCYYTVWILVSAKLASFVYAYFCYRSVQFIAWTTSITGGENLKSLVKSSMALLPIRSDVVYHACNIFPGVDFSFSLVKYAKFASHGPVSYLMAFMVFVIFASVIGYFLTVLAVGQTRAYVVIRYLKDGYKIDNEEPEHAVKPRSEIIE